MKKAVLFALSVFFLMHSASAAGWGVITEETDTEIDGLKKNYTLGLVNTGERPVVLEFSATKSPDYEIGFEDPQITLQPSYTTESPEGSGWFYSGNGEYVNVTYTGFKLEASEDRSSNDINFNITASASPSLNPLQRNVPRQSIVSQRNFEYDLMIDRTLVEGLGEKDDSIWGGDRSGDEKNADERAENTTDQIEDNKTSLNEKETDLDEDEENVNTTTLILMSLLALTVAYLLY